MLLARAGVLVPALALSVGRLLLRWAGHCPANRVSTGFPSSFHTAAGEGELSLAFMGFIIIGRGKGVAFADLAYTWNQFCV
mgnify:CR=1 FL=1